MRAMLADTDSAEPLDVSVQAAAAVQHIPFHTAGTPGSVIVPRRLSYDVTGSSDASSRNCGAGSHRPLRLAGIPPHLQDTVRDVDSEAETDALLADMQQLGQRRMEERRRMW